MSRPGDWAARLAAVVAAHQRPFSWGRCDCCTLAAGVIVAQGGPDLTPATDYQNEAGALLVLAQLGDLTSYLDRNLLPCRPSHAAAGDLALLASDAATPALAVRLGGRWWAMSVSGVAPLMTAEPVRVWRVN